MRVWARLDLRLPPEGGEANGTKTSDIAFLQRAQHVNILLEGGELPLESYLVRPRRCFWGQQVNGDGDEAEKGRTRVISGTSHPVWKDPPEAFILTAVEEMVFEVGENAEARTVKYPNEGD